MNNYGELNTEPEKRIQFAFKGKHQHILKKNMPNMAFPGQHIDIENPHWSRDHLIVSGTLKPAFNLDVESMDKIRSVINNVRRAQVKKKNCLKKYR